MLAAIENRWIQQQQLSWIAIALQYRPSSAAEEHVVPLTSACTHSVELAAPALHSYPDVQTVTNRVHILLMLVFIFAPNIKNHESITGIRNHGMKLVCSDQRYCLHHNVMSAC